MPDATPTPTTDPGPDRIHYVIAGHELTGRRNPLSGRWTFASTSWPELAREFNGSTGPATVVAAFTRRALAEASPWNAADVL